MRESIGGAFLFNLVLIFLGIYIALISFGIVYARAFNSKNHIITLIEEHESVVNEEITAYMASRGFDFVPGNCEQICSDIYDESRCLKLDQVTAVNGTCIYKFSNSSASIYGVATFLEVDIPILKNLLHYWPIAGETRTIYKKNK